MYTNVYLFINDRICTDAKVSFLSLFWRGIYYAKLYGCGGKKGENAAAKKLKYKENN